MRDGTLLAYKTVFQYASPVPLFRGGQVLSFVAQDTHAAMRIGRVMPTPD